MATVPKAQRTHAAPPPAKREGGWWQQHWKQGVPIAVLAVIGVTVALIVVLQRGGDKDTAAVTPAAAIATTAPAVAPAPGAPIAATPATQQPAVTVPSKVLKFENTVALYKAATAGEVPLGAVVEVRGILDPLHSINDFTAGVDIANSTDRLEVFGGAVIYCSPTPGKSHNVRGLERNDRITVRGEVQSARPGHAGPSLTELTNCTIVSR